MTGVKEPVFKELVSAGSVRDIIAVAQGRHWHIEAQIGLERRPVQAKRGHLRSWGSLDTLARYLRRMGVAEWRIHGADYDPKQSRLT
mgnify:CR=1 FL=1